MEDVSRMLRGRLFQMDGPATANDLSPMILLQRGIMRRVLSLADLVTGPLRVAVLRHRISVRYGGAQSLRHL